MYHLNTALGIPNEAFTFGDSVVLTGKRMCQWKRANLTTFVELIPLLSVSILHTVLGQLAFMPTLVLAARLCPPGIEGTLFATLMSIFNGAGALGAEMGALLTSVLGITESNFDRLGLLVTICNFSSLIALPFLSFLGEEGEKEEGPGNGTSGGK